MQQHLIDKVTMEIGLNESRLAFDFQNSCSQLIHDELLSVIDEVCSELSSSDEHIIIDKIELDLGKLSARNFKWEMLEKFKSEFSLKTQKSIDVRQTETAIAELTSVSKSIDSVQSVAESEFEIQPWEVIKYFLKSGVLPWYIDSESYPGFEPTLLSLMDSETAYPDEFRELLKTPQVLSRLLYQTSETTRNLLYAELFQHPVNWIDFFDVVEKTILELPHIVTFPPHHSLWESIWSASLLEDQADQIFASLWKTILHNYPKLSELILPKLSQHQSRLLNVSGLQKTDFFHSLEIVKQDLQTFSSIKPGNSPTLFKDRHNMEHSEPFSESELNAEEKQFPSIEPRLQTNLQPEKSPLNRIFTDKSAVDARDFNQTQTPQDPDTSSNLKKKVSLQGRPPAGLIMTEETNAESIQQKFTDFQQQLHKLQQQNIEHNEQSQSTLHEQPKLQRYPVDNAGLVIFWPYLQIFFADLGLLQDDRFKHPHAQQKALQLLQYLATGEENVEEHQLILNKVLCNWPLQQPVDRFISLSEQDKKEAETLLNAIIKNWAVLGHTSIPGLRLNFIQRKGLLVIEDSGWLLRVEKGPYDVLLERIPWSLSMIKLSWMEKLLQVEW